MADVTLVNTLLSGIPSMLVALVGVGGVIYTQRRADARQDRIAEANRKFERDARLLDTRRAAGADLIAEVWKLAAHSRSELPDEGDFTDLRPDEIAAVYRSHAVAQSLTRPAGRPLSACSIR